ncbi:MAG TPA: SDR family NAD(P)-dependent oxidoreductase, partial [Anaerolinea sp.]|nr:SDR family NAD(P)-dependent oxidoreductase [Anaerolinea sp.]
MKPQRKRVVVTGASSGIGKATAERFGKEGWDVCLVARRAELLEAVRRSLPAGDHLVCAGSYDDPQTAQALSADLKRTWGELDVLVNCEGVYM